MPRQAYEVKLTLAEKDALIEKWQIIFERDNACKYPVATQR